MRIRVGCEMTYHFGQATPMIVMLNVHASRVSDLEQPDYVLTTPSVRHRQLDRLWSRRGMQDGLGALSAMPKRPRR